MYFKISLQKINQASNSGGFRVAEEIKYNFSEFHHNYTKSKVDSKSCAEWVSKMPNTEIW